VIQRFGVTSGLPLFNATAKKIPEPIKSRFEAAPKSMAMATDTRKLSHVIATHDKLRLAEKQFAVLEALIDVGPASNEEIAHYLGWPINRVVGRTFELRQFGVVLDGGRRKCRITGNLVHIWRLK
jgi:hypothetical protein